MSIIKKMAIACGFLFGSAAFAGSMGKLTTPPSWQPLLAFSIGPSWTQGGNTQTLFLQPDLKKTYTDRKHSQSFTSAEIFVGIQKTMNPNIIGQLGLAFSGSGIANFDGAIWDDADPDFNNDTYSYKLSNHRVAVKGRAIACPACKIQPYVSGSVGLGINHAKDFMVTPRIYEVMPPPAFTVNTKKTFSYTLGAGIQKSLFVNWQLAVGYELADWGKSNLGPAPGQTTNKGLSLNHLYVQQVQFTVIYIV